MKGAWVLTTAVLAAAAPAGLRLLERHHPKIAEGIAAYDRSDFDAALKAFDAARSELPNNATVELNRGNALFRMGRLDEAKEAFARAAELDEDQLKARDEYNLGTTLAHLGKREEAIAALRRALVKDPTDEQARHNLEVLLRQLPPPQQSPDGGTDGGQDGGPPDAGPSDAGQDGGRDAGPQDGGSDGGNGDGGADGGQDGGPGDGGSGSGPAQDGGRDGGEGSRSDAGGSSDPMKGRDGGEAAGNPELSDGGTDGGIGELTLGQVKETEAERMLDAMRQNEKNLQLWRFQQKKRTRKPDEKDW